MEDLVAKRRAQSVVIWLLILAGYLFVWILAFLGNYSGTGRGVEQALKQTRDPSLFKWYVIPFLLIVLYFYFEEAAKKNWSGIVAGLGFFLWDFFNEIWNAMYYHITHFASPWIAVMSTAYQPLIGWNIEIIFNFLIMGLAATKLLPEDKYSTIWGLNNRHFLAIVMAILCVVVEIVLNSIGALVWNFSWWNAKMPFLIFLLGYLPFWEFAFYLYDLEDMKKKVAIVGVMGTVLIVVFTVLVGMRVI